MNIIKVSIIIPVYNAEKYIERCVLSLMEQTMKEGIEFLFINDCTPDNSMDVLQHVIDDYPERKEQIRIINHEENRGIAYTRGEGIREARGEYIGWCDSDDWCESSMYEVMYIKSQELNAEIVVCSNYEDTPIGNKAIQGKDEAVCGFDYLKYYYLRKSHVMFLWKKIIKRKLLTENLIFPYEGINISEDLNICIRAFYYSKKVVFLPNPLYHYNVTNFTSITHEKNFLYNKWIQQKKNIELLSTFLQIKNEQFNKTVNFLKYQVLSEYDNIIPTLEERFYTFKEMHHDIIHFKGLGKLSVRIKMALLYSCFLIFKYYHNKKK